MESVSRRDLFHESEPQDIPSLELGLEIREVDVTDDPDDGIGGLTLFGDQTVGVEALESDDEETLLPSRPATFYFSRPSAEDRVRFAHAAVTGDSLLAQFASVAKASTAPNVNEGWRPPKRPCRPGSRARQRRRDRALKQEQDRKALQRLRQQQARLRRQGRPRR